MNKPALSALISLACLPFALAAQTPEAPALRSVDLSAVAKPAAATPANLTAYAKSATLAEGLFKQSLGGICLDAKGNLVVGGDQLVVTFDTTGKEIARHKLDFTAGAVLAAGDAIYVADNRGKRVVKLGADGKVAQTLSDNLRSATGLAMHGDILLVADSSGGCVHKFGKDGKALGTIARKAGARRGNIATCCGILDVSVNEKGDILVAELGAHRVSVYNLEGTRTATWGKEGDRPEDFCGCCNPVSITSAKNAVVVSEKTIPRVKIYSADGSTLKAVIGLKDFAAGCSDLDLAAGADGRIYATDEVRRAVLVFSPAK